MKPATAQDAEPYPVVEVEPEWALSNEEMGTKSKFWYRYPSQETACLFKYPQPNTGQHWAEKIVAEIACLVRVSHARVELAVYGEQRGSVTESFLIGQKEMIHGNQLLTDAVSGYDPGRRFHQSSHTIEHIWTALEHTFGDPQTEREAKSRIAEYLVLDAVIGNTDRHHENWGILRERHGRGWRHAVAPSFDHASSLGRELRDERRDRLMTEHRVGSYLEQGRGAIFWSTETRYGPSPLQLVRFAAASFSDLFFPALRKIARLDQSAVHETVHRVPEDWMSPSQRRFAIEVMTYGLDQLRRLGGE